MRPTRITALVLVLAGVAGCELFPVVPSPGPQGIVRGAWLWPAPAPLPPGAVAVPIDAAQPIDLPPDAVLGCDAALLGSIVAAHRAGEEPPVRYAPAAGGDEVHVRWPAGFSARLNPELEIVAPDGRVFATEGKATIEFGGGMGADDRFWICMPEYGPKPLDR